MGQPLDLDRLAKRMQEAAERVSQSPHGLRTEATTTDLMVIAGPPARGVGQARTESLPFALLFHDDEDRLGQALDRLERYCASGDTGAPVRGAKVA